MYGWGCREDWMDYISPDTQGKDYHPDITTNPPILPHGITDNAEKCWIINNISLTVLFGGNVEIE